MKKPPIAVEVELMSIEEEFRSQNSEVRIKTLSTFAQRVEDRR
ncbi:hypothetical protein [Nostoc sp.]